MQQPNEPATSRRIKIYLVVLAFVSAAGAAHLVDMALMRNALEAEAARQVEDLKSDALAKNPDANFEVVHKVTVGRKYAVVGPSTGKITIYTYTPDKVPEEDLIPNMLGRKHQAHPLQGIEYVYGKNADGWQPTESVACSSEQCQTEGRAVFEAAKIEIPEDFDHDDH